MNAVTVLVASGGGHLQQLSSLVPRLSLNSDILWATPKTGLSESLLRGQPHVDIPYTRPRDWHAAARLAGLANEILVESGATRIISTGASPAPPFFLAGASLGLEMHYIESATRSAGPSLSGKLVAMLPSVHLYCQYPNWAGGRWHYKGSILDAYSPVVAKANGQQARRAVVTLGTETFGFRRAVERLLQVLPPECQTVWQTGTTDVEGLGIDARESIPSDELRAAMAEADLVVCHAGTGSALAAFELGKAPVILPRESRHGEHIDDHQQLLADELEGRGLAVSVAVDELTPEHLNRARSLRVVRDSVNRPFILDDEIPRRSIVDPRSPRVNAFVPRRAAGAVMAMTTVAFPTPRAAPDKRVRSQSAEVIDLR